MHVLTLWMAILDATLYMDKSAHSLKLGLLGVKGLSDICCVCGRCAQVQSPTRHWESFDLTTFRGWRMESSGLPVPLKAPSKEHPLSQSSSPLPLI